MEPQYWQQAWQEGRTGFHQSKVNTRLEHWFPTLGVPAGAEVFVPLCGKSLDMLWLHRQGYRVYGVELSQQAVQAFFAENGVGYRTSVDGDATLFEGIGEVEGLRVLVGDYFSLDTASVPAFGGFYDRAALIAMPPAMRQRYLRQLATLLPAACAGLLLTIDYDQQKMQGPPFAVPDADVRTLLDPWFAVQPLMHGSGPERLGNLAERGLETLDEYVYCLTRRG